MKEKGRITNLGVCPHCGKTAQLPADAERLRALVRACRAALDDANCGREASFETRDLLEAALRPECEEGGKGNGA